MDRNARLSNMLLICLHDNVFTVDEIYTIYTQHEIRNFEINAETNIYLMGIIDTLIRFSRKRRKKRLEQAFIKLLTYVGR